MKMLLQHTRDCSTPIARYDGPWFDLLLGVVRVDLLVRLAWLEVAHTPVQLIGLVMIVSKSLPTSPTSTERS